jgi:predicted dehydrogenase
MSISLGLVGSGQFAPTFATLFKAHPLVSRVVVTDLLPERARQVNESVGLDGVAPDFEALLADPTIDSVAIFTQRWTHGPLVVQALNAGKHVYSAVPMAITRGEIAAIIEAVRATGLTYMMGETSFYNPATVFARQQLALGKFGRVFYSEGDDVHDMDLGFYDAYRYSGGDAWKSTASFPPMLYPTHAIGGVLGALPTHVTSVSCIGIVDDRGDGVFDRQVSKWSNNFSNESALFELADGGVMRTNEMRRVGYPSHLRESRFRYFGTEGSFEEFANAAIWQDRDGVTDMTAEISTTSYAGEDDPALAHVSPALRGAFATGHAAVHDISRLPSEFAGLHSGHEGSHHFLVDDFVTAVAARSLPPVNAWQAARFTLPGIVAHESALAGGARLAVDDFGDAPV